MRENEKTITLTEFFSKWEATHPEETDLIQEIADACRGAKSFEKVEAILWAFIQAEEAQLGGLLQ